MYGDRGSIMAANNDGMDPEWKPTPEPIPRLLKTTGDLLVEVNSLCGRFEKWSDEQLDQLERDGMGVSCHFTIPSIRRIREVARAADDKVKEQGL